MILDDRYALTLFCNLDFESATSASEEAKQES